MEDVINVINLGPDQIARSMHPACTPEIIKRSREERVLSIVKQSKEQGAAVRFWEGEICRDKFIDGRVGILRSFKKIVRWAKENNLERVTIGEDDLLFSAPGAWQYYLDNIPEDYDTFLGSVYSGQIENGRILNGYSGHTLLTVHSRFFDLFLALKEHDHCDRQLGNFCFERKFIVCQPFVVFQIPESFSDNHNRMASHEEYLKEMKFFGDPA